MPRGRLIEDLTGRLFGRLTVLKLAHQGQNGRAIWVCQCSCSSRTLKEVPANLLKTGGTRSCGCLRRETTSLLNKAELVGMVFGRLTVVAPASNNSRGLVQWLCHCLCGGTKVTTAKLLKNGECASCGCLTRETAAAMNFKHGFAREGRARSKEYRSWAGMMTRCYNQASDDYPNYGGRGIRVCERWHRFENFLEDMGLSPGRVYSVERNNVDGAYEPNNCRWATPLEQSRNKRTNRWITWRGEAKVLTDWCAAVGLSQTCVRWRLDHGWDVERALTTPSQGGARVQRDRQG